MVRKSLEDRFWEKVDKTGDCWEWTGCKIPTGYGRISVSGKTPYAHRVSWEMSYGTIPVGEGHHGTCVLHACDNPSCVNPDHLFLGTQQDNVKDRGKKGRTASTCGEASGNAKLTDQDVLDIRAIAAWRLQKGRKLAEFYRVSEANISSIIHRKTWRHI